MAFCLSTLTVINVAGVFSMEGFRIARISNSRKRYWGNAGDDAHHLLKHSRGKTSHAQFIIMSYVDCARRTESCMWCSEWHTVDPRSEWHAQDDVSWTQQNKPRIRLVSVPKVWGSVVHSQPARFNLARRTHHSGSTILPCCSKNQTCHASYGLLGNNHSNQPFENKKRVQKPVHLRSRCKETSKMHRWRREAHDRLRNIPSMCRHEVWLYRFPALCDNGWVFNLMGSCTSDSPWSTNRSSTFQTLQ